MTVEAEIYQVGVDLSFTQNPTFLFLFLLDETFPTLLLDCGLFFPEYHRHHVTPILLDSIKSRVNSTLFAIWSCLTHPVLDFHPHSFSKGARLGCLYNILSVLHVFMPLPFCTSFPLLVRTRLST